MKKGLKSLKNGELGKKDGNLFCVNRPGWEWIVNGENDPFSCSNLNV